MVRLSSISLLATFLVTAFLSTHCRMALAQSVPLSCLPNSTLLQAFEVLSPQQEMSKTYRAGDTPVLIGLHYSAKDKTGLHLKFKFEDPNAMSLPFNIYGVLVAGPNLKPTWIDLTEGCFQPGVGFYPGQTVEIPISMDLKGNTPIHLMVWGRH